MSRAEPRPHNPVAGLVDAYLDSLHATHQALARHPCVAGPDPGTADQKAEFLSLLARTKPITEVELAVQATVRWLAAGPKRGDFIQGLVVPRRGQASQNAGVGLIVDGGMVAIALKADARFSLRETDAGFRLIPPYAARRPRGDGARPDASPGLAGLASPRPPGTEGPPAPRRSRRGAAAPGRRTAQRAAARARARGDEGPAGTVLNLADRNQLLSELDAQVDRAGATPPWTAEAPPRAETGVVVTAILGRAAIERLELAGKHILDTLTQPPPATYCAIAVAPAPSPRALAAKRPVRPAPDAPEEPADGPPLAAAKPPEWLPLDGPDGQSWGDCPY